MHFRSLRKYLFVPLTAALLLSGCSGTPKEASPTPTSTDETASQTAETPQVLRVSAAASLKETFSEIGSLFETANPGVKVEITFDGSSTLVQQLIEGANQDVFASADQANMDKVVAAELLEDEPQIFVKNFLTLAVPKDNPANITKLEDLTGSDVRVALCAPEVPCGRLSHIVLDDAGLSIDGASEEQSVKGVLTKISEGEVDAGMVYVTDTIAAESTVTRVDLPKPEIAGTSYPIALLKSSENPDLANKFIEFVRGAESKVVFEKAGFKAP